MTASLKLRDGQSPLLNLKLPLTLLGLRLVSGVTVGDDDELALRFAIACKTGPCCEICYRPNDSTRPFSLGLKADFSRWGYPAGAAVAMAADFSVVGSSNNPAFRLWIKPRAGDFSLRRDFSFLPADSRLDGRLGSQSLVINGGERLVADRSRQGPAFAADDVTGAKVSACFQEASSSKNSMHDRVDYDWEHVEGIDSGSRTSSVTEGLPHYDRVVEEEMELLTPKQEKRRGLLSALVAGTHLRASTSLQISRRAQVQIKWRVHVPSSLSDNFAGFSSLSPFTVSLLPYLLVDKIRVKTAVESQDPVRQDVFEEESRLAQVEALCLSTRNAVYSVQLENEALKRAIEDMRKEAGNKNSGLQVDKKPIIELPTEDEELMQTSLFQGYLGNKILLN